MLGNAEQLIVIPVLTDHFLGASILYAISIFDLKHAFITHESAEEDNRMCAMINFTVNTVLIVRVLEH